MQLDKSVSAGPHDESEERVEGHSIIRAVAAACDHAVGCPTVGCRDRQVVKIFRGISWKTVSRKFTA